MSFKDSWQDADWRDEVESWLKIELAALGLGPLTGISLEKSRPWSIVARVDHGQAPLYFKASSPSLSHEPAVTAWLAQHYPDLVPEVLATRVDRGWLLQRSAGAKWREALENEALLSGWRDLLPAYGTLQQDIQAHMQELLSLGLPDRQPTTLPEHVKRWLDFLKDKKDTEYGLASGELSRLEAMQPQLEASCLELAGMEPGPSINHGDLHDANVGQQDEGLFIFDWGDASLSHPFFSLRTTFVSVENRLGWPEKDGRFSELRDVYLSSWVDSAEGAILQRSFELASQLWSLGSALSWEAALVSFGQADPERYGHVLPSLLRELLAAFGQEIERPI